MTRELSDAEIYALNEIQIKREEIFTLLKSLLARPSLNFDLYWFENAHKKFGLAFNSLKYSIEKPDLTEGDE